MTDVLFLVGTYLVAAVPFGVAVTTLFGGEQDVRETGSGNIGATNVARVYGWTLAGPVLFLDMLKGFLPVVIGWTLWSDRGLWWPALVAAVAWIAHCYPVYLEFRGGKGVATGAGAMLALSPLSTALAALTWGGVLFLTGRSSVAALVATGVLVVAAWFLHPSVLPVAALLAVGIALTHVGNIRRLFRGEESTVVKPVRFRRGEPTGSPPGPTRGSSPPTP